jgi:hypothetical protein
LLPSDNELLCRHERAETSLAVRCPIGGAKPGEKCELALACPAQSRIQIGARQLESNPRYFPEVNGRKMNQLKDAFFVEAKT